MASHRFGAPAPGISPGDKLFFAALPSAAARYGAWAWANLLQGELGRPAYRVPARCLHVTLAGLGAGYAMSPARLARAQAAAGRVSAAAFLAAFNRIESWRGDPRPRVLTGEDGVIGLCRLQERLCMALAAAGFEPRWAANFTPHMTLMRDRKETPIRFIAPILWRVESFALVQSHVGEGRYTVLGEWPLRGDPSGSLTKLCRVPRQAPC
ncbi:2'-5' RNA ligase family protein [Phenylobacterium sp.]|uniref:2'-5' RNA ligase family protein n=1 Tax=Phenylobacterium sp. TaxID=1871053 RepID=UPI0011F90983|nr:2'-5' RNA ligase family protein [Phenylobacterium sp.]THD63836.1 MAG: RNA 2',3'-cyclic phosphodiesterase [Phenylobacterium sp.]